MPGLGHWYIEITKQAFWRGVPHTWQNRYVMSGGDPSASEAGTCIDALKAIENLVYPTIAAAAGVGFVKGSAYKSTGGPPLQTNPYNISESAATATGFTGPAGGYTTLTLQATLENCLEVRTPLAGLSSTGKPVELRKFFRGLANGSEDSAITPIAPADLAKVVASVAPWRTGVGPYARTVIGTSGRAISAPSTVQQWIGNHQVPRGRKRLSSALAGAEAYAQGVVSGAALAVPGNPDLG